MAKGRQKASDRSFQPSSCALTSSHSPHQAIFHGSSSVGELSGVKNPNPLPRWRCLHTKVTPWRPWRLHSIKLSLLRGLTLLPNAPQRQPRAGDARCKQSGIAGSAGCGCYATLSRLETLCQITITTIATKQPTPATPKATCTMSQFHALSK